MLKHHKYIVFHFILYFFLLAPNPNRAQENSTQKVNLIGYLEELEREFNIKFSYVDQDLGQLRFSIPSTNSLPLILEELRKQTLLDITQLNDRYFALSKSKFVDICANVVDNFENSTIVNATVEVLGSNISQVTDMKGQFQITKVPRNANIAIKHLGFKTKYLSAEELAANNSCKTILLSPNYQQLDEVVVYQFLTTGITKEPDASIELNTDKFGILPGLIEPDILQTIQALPGIKSVDETVSDINVRGGTNDQNLVLWDGIKMYHSGHFFGLISAFNPYLIENVNIIKNGTSVQYGDGVSSVININTRNKISDSLVGGAGFNLLSGDVFGQLPLSKKISVQFSGRRSTTDFINTPTYNRFFDKVFQDSEVKENENSPNPENTVRDEDFYFYDFTGKLLYDINENQKARLSFINTNNHLKYTEKTGDGTAKSLLDQTNLSFGGSLESKWTPRWSTHLNLYYTRYNLDSQNIPSPSQQLFQSNQVLEKAIKLNTYYHLGQNLGWLNGYQLNEVGITNFTQVSQPSFKSNIKGVIMTHSLFSELDYRSKNEKFHARGGLRLNYIKNLKTFKTFEEVILEPRLNINYAITDRIKAELLGEFKSQTTNQIIDLEQNFLGIEKRRWMLSDNDVLPITKSKQISLGLNYDKNTLYVGVEGFYKKVDGISTTTQGFQNQDQFNGEIGKYDVSGIEFLINKKTATYSTWLSYAYNTNNYTFENITPQQFPNNLDIRHTLTFAGTYTYKSFRMGLGANYHTGRPYTKPQEGNNAIIQNIFPNQINYMEPNSSRLPAYLRADASFIYNFKMGQGIRSSVGASVLNLLNKKNILNIYYRINEQNEIETIERVSLGITPNFSFRLSF
ncbi:MULTISPECIES: carboxypeptidase-like regulatory domain-containing protein [unclassified Arenibacter]|uniref:TonB-dependent receptor n=1 Tax=unclassified Arenibacter TaxID=2615047 RepID=UPI000E3439A8|nr:MULTISPECIES: carboxypeptidase-like regulatory domain-containing protein [unclassified Arenibacter]MCM4164318.1 TonB-dependent receptor [Arenibacter sp. A80]RFT56099.1 TonB-dependent receptor [Arenibacter sp. P308M17]